jgi:hypothetical protein
MGLVPMNTLHFILLPWEVYVMRICVAGQLGYIVGAFSVVVLPVGWVLVDLGVGVVCPCERRCASSRTVGMCISACSTLLGMYHGAFTIVRKTLF